MKRNKSLIICIISIVFFLIILLPLLCEFIFHAYEQNKTKQWKNSNQEELHNFMPAYEEGKEYVSCRFLVRKRSLFCELYKVAETAECLELTFSPENFEIEKGNVLSELDFYEEAIPLNENWYVPIPAGDMGEYRFKIIKTEMRLKQINMLAWNEETNTFRYISASMGSLDYFENESDFVAFIQNSFHIKW